MEIISYGGGVQTVALVVLTAQGKVDNPATHAVFSDTGSELIGTYNHIEQVMKPYMEQVNIKFITVRNEKYGKLHEYQVENKHPMIPMYGDQGGMLRRQCTDKFKIRPVRRWLRAQGAKEATVQLGISWDEVHRMKEADVKWCINRFPLVEMKITRSNCMTIIEDAELSVPPKSACFMCPFRRISGWRELRERSQEEFDAAVAFESEFDGEFLTSSRQPLDQVIGRQMMMFKEDDECGGYCWT